MFENEGVNEEVDVDSLLEGIESEGVETPVEVEAQVVSAPVEAPIEHEFVHNGKQIRASIDQLKKWAQQGYDYPQKMAEINRQRELASNLESSYKPIDDWVKANPDRFEELQSLIHAKKEGYSDLPSDHPLLQKINQFESFANEIKSEREAEKNKRDDQALDAEIQSIRERFKDLDWATADADGRTREQLVVNHANKSGLTTFKAAFLDLYHDDLLKAAEARGKEQVVADKQRQLKTGLLSTKKAPTQVSKSTGKHYESTESILSNLADLGL